MRNVVLGLGISLDGYIARLDGSVDFLVMDPDYDWAAFAKSIDTWLIGRKTLDVAVKMGKGKGFKSGGLSCYVFSRTNPPGKQKGFEYTNREPADLVSELRKSPGKDIWLGGGGELARAFLEQDLIDRIDLGIVPAVLGSGIPLFPAGFPERKFKLLECRGYPKTGMVTLSYARARD